MEIMEYSDVALKMSFGELIMAINVFDSSQQTMKIKLIHPFLNKNHT